MPIRTFKAAPLVVLLSLLAGGCDYFDPTRPEPPTGSVLVPRYTAAETTLVTMKLAIEDKSQTNGQDAYAGAFDNAYQATFDPITTARFPGQSTDWDRDREQIFYAKLSRLQPGSSFLFTWGNNYPGAPNDDHQGTTALLYRSYQLLATTDNQTYVPVAKGLAELYFVEDGINWKIVRWQDHEDPQANFDIGEVSFGQLRLAGGQ